jgi:hypothetical protein
MKHKKIFSRAGSIPILRERKKNNGDVEGRKTMATYPLFKSQTLLFLHSRKDDQERRASFHGQKALF